MKRLTTIVTTLFVAAGVALWISQSYVSHWEPQLRAEMEHRLGAALGARIHADAIVVSFLHRISITNVEVWDTRQNPETLVFRAKEIVLTPSLIDLPRALIHRNLLESIGLIRVEAPYLSLSPEWLAHLRQGSPSSSHSVPLWFAVEWNQATLQWKDPVAPHGAWSLDQSNGFFRLRGPHMEALAQGVVDQADSIELRLSTLGKRWTAQARLTNANIPSVLDVAQRFMHKPPLPDGWKAEGRANGTLKCGGRWPLASTKNRAALIQEGRITLTDVQLTPGRTAAPLHINGNVLLKGPRLDFSGFSIKADANTFKITGHAWPFSAPVQLDVQAANPKMDLAALLHYAVPQSSSPGVSGTGAVDISIKGTSDRPAISIQAKVPQGQLLHWPFQNLALQVRGGRDHWDIDPSTLRLWEGNCTLQGTVNAGQADLKLTGNDLSLQSLSTLQQDDMLKGRLHFSLSSRGPLDGLHTVGSFWINSLSWAHTSVDAMRGDLDVTPTHFQLQGASENDGVHVQAEGTRTPKTLTLQKVWLQLRPGMSLGAHGTWTPESGRLHLVLDAKNLSLSEDIPEVKTHWPALHGHADIQGSLDGTIAQPLLKADIQSLDLQLGNFPASKADAAVRWTSDELSVESFHSDLGYSGSWRQALTHARDWDLKLTLDQAQIAPVAALFGKEKYFSGRVSGTTVLSQGSVLQGNGLLTLTNGALGTLSLSDGAIRFKLKKNGVDVQRLTLASAQGKADFKGQFDWPPPMENHPLDTVYYHAEGRIGSPDNPPGWSAVCRLNGQIHPPDGSGELKLTSPAIVIHDKESDPLEGTLRWNKTGLTWEAVRWGHSLSSNGALRFGDDHAALSGLLQAQQLDLARWQGVLWPNVKDPVQGTLSAAFTLSGSPQEPVLQFSGKAQQAHWRAFHFESRVQGTWQKKGLEPFTMDATLASGGQFHFQGRVSLADQTASGSLDLTQVNLKPLGESLAFPYPTEGTVNGTLTVNGPLDGLRFAGHVAGTSLMYGKAEQNPLKLESCVMDLKLEPVDGQPSITRLTIARALAKTQEEEIRLSPGSFVEFAGPRQARMQISSEIRNLHLGVFTLFGGVDVNGTWEIRPQGFALQGDIFTRSLYINDYQLEQGHVQANYYNRALTFDPPRAGPALVTGFVDFQKLPQLSFKEFKVIGHNHEGLRLNGTIGPQVWNFILEGEGLDLHTLGGLAGFPYPLEGSANARIKGLGDLDHPNVQGTLDVRDGRALGLNFQNGSAAFAWQGQQMTFTRLQLSDPGRYTLSGTGVFPLTAKTKNITDKTIDFSVRLTDSNMGLLKSISPEVKDAKGSVQALLQIKGTTDDPKLRGSLRVKNGDVDGAHYFRHVKDVQIAADFDGNTLVISDFRGKSGKGEFSGGGHIVFAGFEPKFYDLHLDVPSSKGIEVTIPELAIPESPLAKKLHFLAIASQGDVKGKVTFRGPADEPVFFGKAYISNGHFNFPPSSKTPPPAAFMEWIRRIIWDVDLHFSDEAWYENELVEANLMGNLALKGPSRQLKVDGGMDITEGKISYLGVEFNIRQARFEIHSTEGESGLVTTPYVRGIADSHVQTVDPLTGQGVDDTITLTVNYAPINEIKPQLRSNLDPGLAQDKLLARVTQLETENLTPQERSYLYQQQMVRLIDTSLATPLARSLLKRTGLVDELRVSRVINPANAPLPTDPANPSATQQDSVTNLLAGTKYTVAKNLSNRLSLGYGLRFEQITNQDLTNKLDLRSDVEMSYRFLSNLYLRGSFDLPNSTPGTLPDRRVTIEPHWRFGWWGNTNKAKPKPPKPGETPAAP